jgi:hypothetical protein
VILVAPFPIVATKREGWYFEYCPSRSEEPALTTSSMSSCVIAVIGFSPHSGISTRSNLTLAELIGTTRPRVNEFMNKFRRLGLISYNGKLEVQKGLLNYVLQEKPHLQI